MNFIKRSRKENVLDLSKIPHTFVNFFIKGLALKKKNRYQAIGDTADEFSELCSNVKSNEFSTQEQDTPSAIETSQSEFDKFLAQSTSPDFLLDVQQAEEGSLDDLVGLDDLKRYLRNDVLAILKNPEKAKKYKLTIPNGLLLYGPPGCGKTAVAKAFAAECRMHFAVVNSQEYVVESVVVDRASKLVALVYLDNDAIKKAGLDEETVSDLPENIRVSANKNLAVYSKIAKVEVMDEPFAKTPKMSIKRFLYK